MIIYATTPPPPSPHANPALRFLIYIIKSGYLVRNFIYLFTNMGDRGSTVVKVLCYKSEGRWFDPSWYQWIFH